MKLKIKEEINKIIDYLDIDVEDVTARTALKKGMTNRSFQQR